MALDEIDAARRPPGLAVSGPHGTQLTLVARCQQTAAHIVGETNTGDDGQEVSLQLLHAGDSFGESGLLDGAPRTATVRAAAEVEAGRFIDYGGRKSKQ